MRCYYVPVSSYWPYEPIWLVGPFSDESAARAWFEAALADPQIDEYPRLSPDIRTHWYAVAPLSRAAAQRRCAYSRRDVDRYTLPVTTRPTLAAIRAAVAIQQEYLDATR